MSDIGSRTAKAAADVVNTLEHMESIKEVKTEEVEASARGNRITVLMGDYRSTYQTGRLLKREQDLRLVLDVKGTGSDTPSLLVLTQLIDETLNDDYRRNGFAQTTVTPGWTVNEQSRDGAQLETTITLFISER